MAERTGITFAFAPAFHPALRHAAVPRRELGVGTTFNLLGPLANPARPAAQAIGCADARMAPLMAGVYARRGVAAWVFRGDDGLDELTTTTTSRVWLVADGAVSELTVAPEDLGFARGTAEDLRGGDAAHNADVVRRLVDGQDGPIRDAVVLNAGAALAVYGDGAGDPLERLRDARRFGTEGHRRRGRAPHPGQLGGHLGLARRGVRQLIGPARRRPLRAPGRTRRPPGGTAASRSTGFTMPGGVTTRRKPDSVRSRLRRQTNSPGEKSRNRGVT